MTWNITLRPAQMAWSQRFRKSEISLDTGPRPGICWSLV